jgi:ADP-ribose pyrophosphatase YjhB (NUDIX family)
VKFCPECGSPVSLKAVDGDHRKRFVCSGCGITHYDNPRVLVATYVCVGEKILWIKRGIPPAKGLWALPGGFMGKDETPEQAASRELLEETNINVPADQMILVSVSSVLHMAQTHLVFRCHLDATPDAARTEEAADFGWFTDAELPWSDVAFLTIEPQIRQMYSWLLSGNYGIRIGMVDKAGSHYRNYPLVNE